jgi:hypothetical protein
MILGTESILACELLPVAGVRFALSVCIAAGKADERLGYK